MRRLALLLVSACRLHFEQLDDASTSDADMRDALGANSVDITVSGYGAVTGPNGFACVDHCTLTTTDPVTLTALAGEAWQLEQFSAPCGVGTTCVAQPGVAVVATFVAAPIVANRVFVTSTTPATNIGVANLDLACAARATAAGLTGTFVALVSTTTTNAVSRLAGGRGWVRMDGLPFLDLPTDLGQAGSPRSVSFDETGGPTANGFVMTGSTPAGIYSGDNCTNWSFQGAAVLDGALADRAGVYSTGNSGSMCNAAAVFCFETDRAPVTLALHPPFPVGRYVFVTSQPFAMTGIAGADAQCQAEATAAALPGNYVAMIATTTQSVSDRLGGLGGYWRRTDDQVITPTGLDAPRVQAAPHLDAAGVVQAATTVWYGATTPTAVGTMTSTCNDYASTTTAGLQNVAYPDEGMLLNAGGGGMSLCAVALPLLCGQL